MQNLISLIYRREKTDLGSDDMEEKTIRAISPIPYAVITGGISAILSFIIAIILVTVWIPWLTTLTDLGPWQGLFVSIGAATIIVLPIVAFALTFVWSLATVLLYNFLAPRIGGMKLQFEEKTRTK